MIEFKDRKSTFLNRRRLDVIAVKRDNKGEITQIFADVVRNEGTITETGTALNAETLNQMFKHVDNALAYLFKKYIDVGILNVSWVQNVGGELKQHPFRITTTDKFYVKFVTNHQFLSGEVIDKSDYIEVIVKETSVLNYTEGSSTKAYDFYIEVYLDSSYTTSIAKHKGTVNYTHTYTVPLD